MLRKNLSKDVKILNNVLIKAIVQPNAHDVCDCDGDE